MTGCGAVATAVAPTVIGSLMGGGSQGTTTTNSPPAIPSWLLPQMQANAKAAGDTTNVPYSDTFQQNVAPLNAMQNQAGSLAQALPGQTQVGLNQASGIFGQVANYGLNGPTASQIQSYMNPYQQQVMDASQLRQMQQYSQEKNQLMEQQGQTGSFGGSGSAIAQGQLASNFQQQLSENQANQLYQGYQNAQTQGAANMKIAGESALGIGNTAMQGQTATSQNIGNLDTTGGLQQGTAQNVLNANQSNALQQANWGATQAQLSQSILGDMAKTATGNSGTSNAMQTGNIGVGGYAQTALSSNAGQSALSNGF